MGFSSGAEFLGTVMKNSELASAATGAIELKRMQTALIQRLNADR